MIEQKMIRNVHHAPRLFPIACCAQRLIDAMNAKVAIMELTANHSEAHARMVSSRNSRFDCRTTTVAAAIKDTTSVTDNACLMLDPVIMELLRFRAKERKKITARNATQVISFI